MVKVSTKYKMKNLLWITCSISLTFIAIFGIFRGVRHTVFLPVASISHEQGFSYISSLPETYYWLFESLGDDINNPHRSRIALLENNQPLGPAHSMHEVIRTTGGGGFSHWSSALYFSTSDNSDPRTNGRSYTVVITATGPLWILVVAVMCLIISCYFNRQLLQNAFNALPNMGWWYWLCKDILPGILITVIILVALALGGELFLRMIRPFNQTAFPPRFDERFGWTFVPGSTIHGTNHVDFWTSARANSLGFLDREPPTHKRPGVCRIVFIGDSFVEAIQVPIAEKFHVIFEKLANAQIADGRQFESIALAYSGTGQVNQLPFYDIFARPLQPNVVVFVFVANDFANNSTTLESIRNGWHPAHPPRLFFEYDKGSGGFKPIPIDPDWHKFLLPSFPVQGPQPKMITWLESKSYVYNWFYNRFLSNAHIPAIQQVVTWLSGKPSLEDIYRHRKKEIEKLEGFADVFKDWNPDSMDIDRVFNADKIPQVFEEALFITGHAFDKFLERSKDDHSHLLVFIADIVHIRGNNKRLLKLLSERDIPYVDQYDYIISHSGNPMDGRFTRDSHWNVQGHRWAAQAMLEYVQAHAEICR